MNTRKLIVANWKSNKTVRETQEWMSTFAQQELRPSHQYVICPPYPALFAVQPPEKQWSVGVQDLSPYNAGAYTGEVAPYNLQDFAVKYAILGHSERRKYLGETSQLVAKKADVAVASGITPIICVDVNQFEEQADQLSEAVKKQTIIAYEPVHAISTFGGHEDPLEVTLQHITHLRDIFGDVKVLYGGSVNLQNSLTYLEQDSIDGVLVGSASLDAIEFARL